MGDAVWNEGPPTTMRQCDMHESVTAWQRVDVKVKESIQEVKDSIVTSYGCSNLKLVGSTQRESMTVSHHELVGAARKGKIGQPSTGKQGPK